MQGRETLMNGSDTHVRYCWKGKAANIHGATLIMRVLVLGHTKEWFKEKWKSIDWDVVVHYGMVTVSIGVILFSLWALLDHEGML